LIVLDSSFLIGFYNASDAHHEAAAGLMGQIIEGDFGQAYLLEYVFLEVVTVLRMRLGHAQAVSVGRTLLRARELEFVPCSPVFPEAFELFGSHRDSELSLADAAIASVARREAPGWIATFDEDFRSVPGVAPLP
jgi:predicted nucleic acid-binding protein